MKLHYIWTKDNQNELMQCTCRPKYVKYGLFISKFNIKTYIYMPFLSFFFLF